MKRQWIEFKRWYESNSEEFAEQNHLPQTICNWQNSWLKYHIRYCIENNKYFVYPYVSLSTNNGDKGVHAGGRDIILQVPYLIGKKCDFQFPDSCSDAVCYDAFLENEKLATFLKVNEKNVCIDLFGEKKNREKKRYWLTLSKQNYKIVKSYGLELRPWDMNIMDDRTGDDIFLYDTTIAVRNKKKTHNIFQLIQYQYQTSIHSLIKKINIK
jgi:hypothetical protein